MIKTDKGRSWTDRTDEEKLDELEGLWNSMTDDEKELVLKALSGDKSASDSIKAIEESHFRVKPLRFKEWVNDPYYSGEATQNIYPKLKGNLSEIFSSSFFEVILTGSIGWGKSFCAVTGMLYSIYLLTCLRDPHKTFGLAANSPIYFIFLSTTKLQASRTIFQDFQNRFKSIQYFEDFPFDSNFHSYSGSYGDWMNFICISSNSTDAIGLNVFGGIMDEVNYGANSRIEKDSDSLNSRGKPVTKVEKIYSSIVQRVKSRFMKQGSLPGVLFVISSKNNDMDFTAKRISDSKDDPSVYVMDYTPWDVKPEDTFCGDTFRVFFGGRTVPSRVLEDGEEPPHINDESAEVIEIPVEYREDFSRDIEAAIRDIAGKQVPRISPFITNKDSIGWMWNDRDDQHPYEVMEWECGSNEGFRWNVLCNRSTSNVSGRTEENWEPKVNPDSARHVHIDPSINNDVTGLCVGHIERWVDVVLTDRTTGEKYKELKPLIYIDLVLGIRAPKYGEIDYAEVRRLIYEMTDKGFQITYVTADSYQSRDTLQTLKKQGYRTDVLSLDRDPDGYQTLKNALYDKRIRCYKHSKLEKELSELKKDNATGKVDHPDRGSKDLSDSLAGVVTTLTNVRTQAPGHFVGQDNSSSANTHPLNEYYDVTDMMFKG